MLRCVVGLEFLHHVDGPLPGLQRLSQGSIHSMPNEELMKTCCQRHISWFGRQSKGDPLFHPFWLPQLHAWHLLIWTLIRGVLQYHLPLWCLWVGSYWFASCIFTSSLFCASHNSRWSSPRVCTVKDLYSTSGHLFLY